MKPFILSLLLFLSVFANAANLGLEWDAVVEPDLAGYRIYYGTAPGNHTQVFDVGNATSCVIPDLIPDVTYYFVARAYSTAGLESNSSNELAWLVPVPVQRLVLSFNSVTKLLEWTDAQANPPLLPAYVIEYRAAGGQWTKLANTVTRSAALPLQMAAGVTEFRVAATLQGVAGEWSNVLSLTKPSAPQTLRVVMHTSTNLVDWKSVASYTPPPDQPAVFFRLEIVRE